MSDDKIAEENFHELANRIERKIFDIGPINLKDILTSEEDELLRFIKKDIVRCTEARWNMLLEIYEKIDRLSAIAPLVKLQAHRDIENKTKQKRKEQSKPKFIGFESFTLDELMQKVNEFVSSDKCKHFISIEFKISRCAGAILYVGIVTYQTID